MNGLTDLIYANPVAEAILILSLVAGLGLFIGSIRIFGIGLEIAGVLFAGLFFGYLGAHLQPEVLDFLRDFGLVLFVYSIGIQVGPGFTTSLKRDGLRLNALAAAIVLLGVATTLFIHHFAGLGMPTAVGLFSGATTNTPSLAAAQQAIKNIAGVTDELAKQPAIGYAVAYPFGIMGIILTMLLTRVLFRIRLDHEAREYAKSHEASQAAIDTANLIVKNPNLEGRAIADIPELNQNIVISRVKHNEEIGVAYPHTLLRQGDILLAVGTKKALEDLRIIVGELSNIDLRNFDSGITSQRIVVTQKAVLGKTIYDLNLLSRYGIMITRLVRQDIQLTVYPSLCLEFGDTLMVVGPKENLEKAAKEVGNSTQALNHPQLIPVFLGITLGVLLGGIPFYVPGVPAPIKLGLAGGPLLISILFSRIKHIGSVVWHVPAAANFMMREIGIVLFLACVGLGSGDHFVKTLASGHGFYLMYLGAAITFIPLIIVAFAARLFYRINFMTLCGVLAGSMTDPPALAFANTLAVSSAPSLSYATVYPLVMLLRVVSAQILIICFVR